MALPAFNVSKHSVGLGGSAFTLKGFMLMPGSYRRGVQERQSQLVRVGDRYLQDTKVSQWSEFDFSGGAYQEYFADEAMYHWSEMLAPSKGRKALKVVNAMRYAQTVGGADLSVANNATLDGIIDVFAGSGMVLLLDNAGSLHKWVPSVMGDGEVKFTCSSTALLSAGDATCVTYNPQSDKIIVGFSDGMVEERKNTDLTHFRAWRWDMPAKAHASMPADWTRQVTSVAIYSTSVVVGMGDRAFYYSASDKTTTEDGDGHCTSCAWTFVGGVFGQIRKFVEHQGLLLALSCADSSESYLYSTTLSANLALWLKVPYAFDGRCVASYAGRVYVGGIGSPGGSTACAELYEIDGSSFRELKSYVEPRASWAPNLFSGAIHNFCVHEGGLYYGSRERRGLELYDFIGDAFFTSHLLWDGVAADSAVRYVFNVSGALFATVDGPDGGVVTVPPGHFLSDVVPAIELSEYAIEPAILKRWTTLKLYSYNVGWTVQVSQNGGETWNAVERTSTETLATQRVETFNLLGLVTSRALRIRLTYDPLTTVAEGAGVDCLHELQGVALGFIPVPPALKVWNMAVICAERLQTLDGLTDAATDPDEIISQLWTWYKAGTALEFKDRDGVNSLVMITLISEVEPQMRGSSSRESFVTVQLSELGLG